jgi:hypothetical protein
VALAELIQRGVGIELGEPSRLSACAARGYFLLGFRKETEHMQCIFVSVS